MPPVVAGAGVTAGAGLVSSWLSSRQSPAEKAAARAQTGLYGEQTQLAKLIRENATKQYNLSAPAYAKALSYYEKLLNGGRAGINQTLQPQINQITDLYRGAFTSTERNLRGAERDQAQGDLNRDRVAKLSELVGGARKDAAGSLASLSQGGINSSMAGLSGAGGLMGSAAGGYGDMVQMEMQRRMQSNASSAAMGSAWWKIFGPSILEFIKKNGGKAGGAGAGGAAGASIGGLLGGR